MTTALVAGTLVAAKAATSDTPVPDSSGVIVRGGPIRLGPNFYTHGNGTHATVGVNSVGLASNRCDLVVSLTAVTPERVLAVLVEEDETLSRLGIQAGGSGGVGKVVVVLYDRKGKRVCANDRRFSVNANLWLQVTSVVGTTPRSATSTAPDETPSEAPAPSTAPTETPSEAPAPTASEPATGEPDEAPTP